MGTPSNKPSFLQLHRVGRDYKPGAKIAKYILILGILPHPNSALLFSEEGESRAKCQGWYDAGPHIAQDLKLEGWSWGSLQGLQL